MTPIKTKRIQSFFLKEQELQFAMLLRTGVISLTLRTWAVLVDRTRTRARAKGRRRRV